jgi:hypothetical protein
LSFIAVSGYNSAQTSAEVKRAVTIVLTIAAAAASSLPMNTCIALNAWSLTSL